MNIQANIDSDSVIFSESISENTTFEWTVEKFDVKLRPTPETYTFFKEGDTIKAKIIAEPPADLESWKSYVPRANFSDWIQFYKNDVIFEIDMAGNLSFLFKYGFIYPISWVEDNSTISYFEQYANAAEAAFAFSLMDFKLTTDLGKDHFKVKYDFTCKRCLGKTLNYRIYNIHTGIISRYQYMYNNEYNDHYEIIISNPEDKVDSYSLVIPIVTLLVIVTVRFVRRNRKKYSTTR